MKDEETKNTTDYAFIIYSAVLYCACVAVLFYANTSDQVGIGTLLFAALIAYMVIVIPCTLIVAPIYSALSYLFLELRSRIKPSK